MSSHRVVTTRERWLLLGEGEDLSELGRRILELKCRKIVVLETTTPDIVEDE